MMPSSSEPSALRYQPEGLPNMGNTCYMNAALQALRVVFPLLELPSPGGTIYDDRGCQAHQGRLTFLLSRLFDDEGASSTARASGRQAVDRQRLKELEPVLKEIKCIAAARNASFRGNEECDAHEFFRTILDIVHDENNIGTGRDGIYKAIQDQRDHESEAAAAARWLSIMRSRDSSPVTNLFYGQQCTLVQCTECDHKIRTFDQFSSLHIPVPEGKTNEQFTAYMKKKDKKVAKQKKVKDHHTKQKCKKSRTTTEDVTAAPNDSDEDSDHQKGDGQGSDVVGLQKLVSDHLTEVLSVDGYRCPQCCAPATIVQGKQRCSRGTRSDDVAAGCRVHVTTHHLQWPLVLVVHLKRFNYEGGKIFSAFVPPDILWLPHRDEGVSSDEGHANMSNSNETQPKTKKKRAHNDRHGATLERHSRSSLNNDEADNTLSGGAAVPYRKVASVEHEGFTIESGHYTASVLSVGDHRRHVVPAAFSSSATKKHLTPPSSGHGESPLFLHCDDDTVSSGIHSKGESAVFVLYVRDHHSQNGPVRK